MIKKVLFVCHGNICRSPMAEFIMKHLCENANIKEILIDSRATHKDELGSSPHFGTLKTLAKHNINIYEHHATLLSPSDYDKYDIILCMDKANFKNCEEIFGKKENFDEKVKLLLSIAKNPAKEVADPYYTGDFEQTYNDIMQACQVLLKQLNER